MLEVRSPPANGGRVSRPAVMPSGLDLRGASDAVVMLDFVTGEGRVAKLKTAKLV